MAAHILEAAEDDLELAGGEVRVKGSDLSVTLKQVAEMAAGAPGYSMPKDVDPGLEADLTFKPSALTYSNGVQAVEVEVDIGTGAVSFRNYVVSAIAAT